MDTLGSLVDKLGVVNLKMWHNQELLYEIRRLSFEEFQEKHTADEDKQRELYECLKRCCDLNYQRNVLIDEIDKLFVGALKEEVSTEDLTQLKHKSY
jgi:hypothetical protein